MSSGRSETQSSPYPSRDDGNSSSQVSDLLDTHPARSAYSAKRPVFWMQAVSQPLSVQSHAQSITYAAEPGSAAKAVLSEIEQCAERLVAAGETASIDLRFLKSMPEEHAILVGLLGRGEVSAVVNSIGRSEIQETAIPCVWWVCHLNSDDETVGELIEVADIPDLLMSDRESIPRALDALRLRHLS